MKTYLNKIFKHPFVVTVVGGLAVCLISWLTNTYSITLWGCFKIAFSYFIDAFLFQVPFQLWIPLVFVFSVFLFFILWKIKIKKSEILLNQLKMKMNSGYESIISNQELMIGDFSKTVEPVNFINLGANILVLSKYYDVENPINVQIRLDAFDKKGGWSKSFGGNNTGFRYLSVGEGKPLPKQIFKLNNSSFAVIGTLQKENVSESFIYVLDINGQILPTFNNGTIKILNYKGSIVKNCKSGYSNQNKIFLLCSEIENIGFGIICMDYQGNIDLSYGTDGLSEQLSSQYESFFPVSMQYDTRSNGYYVIGKVGSQGIVIKYTSDGHLDKENNGSGISEINSILLHNGFMNQINDLAVLSNGTTITVGSGNNGFAAALDFSGKPVAKIGASGRIDVRSFYRVESRCIAIDNDGQLFIGGMEYDGNSIMNGHISFFSSLGNPIKIKGRQSIHISAGRPTEVIDLLFDCDDRLYALTKDNRQNISFSIFNIYKIET